MSADLNFEPLMTLSQAARSMSVSLRQVRRLVDTGRLPLVKVSARAPRIRNCDLQNFLESVTIRHSRV